MLECNVGDCTRLAVHLDGNSVICERHLCAKHIEHECPKWQVGRNIHPALKPDFPISRCQ